MSGNAASEINCAEVAIIGAGAAGLAAGLFAGEAAAGRAMRIVLLDGAKKIGAKILVSGGGRCNVTHEAVRPGDFQGPRNVVRSVLRRFDEKASAAWFESLGVRLKREETGKLFPVTDDAQTVLTALLRRCDELGVDVLSDHRVSEVQRCEGRFLVRHSHGELRARQVIVATGGRSLPKTGSDGAGWGIVRKLGHTVTPTYPALVPLVLAPTFFHAALSGVAHRVELATYVDGRVIDRRTGSLLWTHQGISGPVVMDASRFWVIAHAEGRVAELRCNLLVEPFETVERWLIAAAAEAPKRTMVRLLAERLPRRVAEQTCAWCGLGGEQPIGQLPRDARRNLVHALTGLALPVVGDRGWNYAEVTAGGVPLEEVDHRTMASRKVEGLFLIGEILDCDGRIGGFNFQWAWSTGWIAGRAAADPGINRA